VKYLITYTLNLGPNSIATDVLGIGFVDAENAPLTQTVLANSQEDAILQSKNMLKGFLYTVHNMPFSTITGNQEDVFDQVFTLQSIKQIG
jgi:hypothetical protein